jgi:putative ABC transport system permease protein
MMGSRAGSRARRALLVLEVAVSVVLLVGATLLGRSLVNLLYTDLGVVTNRVVTASMNLAVDRELGAAQQIALTNRVLEQFRRLPGVEAVGVGTSLPPNESRMLLTMRGADAIDYQAAAVPSTPGYFQALSVRLLKGRFFTDSDDADHPPVMIMTSDTAKRFFGEGDPIGRTLLLPVLRDGIARNDTIELVGIVDNVKYAGLDRPADNAVYRPFAQQPWPNVFLVARTDGDTSALRATLQTQIADVDRAIAVSAVSTLDDVVSDAAAQPRFRTLLFRCARRAGAGAAWLVCTAWSPTRLTAHHQIGIRMALGGTARDVIRMIVGRVWRWHSAAWSSASPRLTALSRTLVASRMAPAHPILRRLRWRPDPNAGRPARQLRPGSTSDTSSRSSRVAWPSS